MVVTAKECFGTGLDSLSDLLRSQRLWLWPFALVADVAVMHMYAFAAFDGARSTYAHSNH